jgi:hypothetical protein
MMAAKGFWTRTKVLEIPKLHRPLTYSTQTGFNMDFELTEVAVNKEIIIYNIYYEFDKANLLETSFTELDKIVTMLKENPNLTVEISAHTDERGNNAYNNSLSQRRAQSVVNYLVEKGIDKKRLVAKGYGKTNPLVKDAVTEEEHQINRRTAFKILQVQEQNIELIIESISKVIPQNKDGQVKYKDNETKQISNSTSNNNESSFEGDILYKVQIAASKNPINIDLTFKKVISTDPNITISEEKQEEGWFRYFAGSYTTMDEAVKQRDNLKALGYPDCFINIYRK